MSDNSTTNAPLRKTLLMRLGLGRGAAAAQAAEVQASGDAPKPEAVTQFRKTHGRDRETGLPNRESIADLLVSQCDIAVLTKTKLSVLVVDGSVTPEGNMGGHMPDTYRALAAGLRMALWRQHDTIGSLGAARFAIILPFTDVPGAEAVARRIRANVPMVLLDQPLDGEDTPPDPGAADGGEGEGGDAAPAPPVPRLRIGIANYCGRGDAEPAAMLEGAERAAEFAGLGEEGGIARAALPIQPAGRVTFVEVPQVATSRAAPVEVKEAATIEEGAYKDPSWMKSQP